MKSRLKHYSRFQFSWFVQLQTNKIQGLFKDFVLFTKSTFLVGTPILTLKKISSVITYLRYLNSSAMVEDFCL